MWLWTWQKRQLRRVSHQSRMGLIYYYSTSAPPSCCTLGHTSHVRRSILVHMVLASLWFGISLRSSGTYSARFVMPVKSGTHSMIPQAWVVLANRRDHLWGIRMPHAKFHADPLKIVAVHKVQRTDIQTHRYFRFYICKIIPSPAETSTALAIVDGRVNVICIIVEMQVPQYHL